VPGVADFTVAFVAVAAISLLAAPAALAMPRDAGAELAGRSAARKSGAR
jgi:hypothetical protein